MISWGGSRCGLVLPVPDQKEKGAFERPFFKIRFYDFRD
jgi:hypothetical protein